MTAISNQENKKIRNNIKQKLKQDFGKNREPEKLNQYHPPPLDDRNATFWSVKLHKFYILESTQLHLEVPHLKHSHFHCYS